LVAPTGLTVAACVLAPPVVALAALGARRGVADGDALRRLGALAAGFVPPVALSFAPSLAAVGPLGLAREIGAGVARLYALPLPWPAGVAGAVGLAAFAARGRGAGALVVAAAAAAAVAVAGGAAGGEAPPAALVALPLAVALGRFLPTALVLGHVATGRVAEVALGGMRLVVEPEGVAPLGAIAAAADAVRDIPPDETVLAFPACGMVPFV